MINDYQRAISDQIKATELNPNYAKAYHRIGNIHFRAGHYTDAANFYQRALRFVYVIIYSN